MIDELVPKVPPKRGVEIDEIARQALYKAFSHPQNALQPFAFINFFEQGGLTRLGLNYGVSALPYGEEGTFDPAENCIILSESTYEALMDDVPRARFTLAHEMGHAILHGAFLRVALEGRTPQRKFKRTSLPAYLDPEWQANRFAGGFLMPTSAVRRCIKEGMTDAKIAQYFRVSLDAARTRISKIG